jgi:thioredoxin 1
METNYRDEEPSRAELDAMPGAVLVEFGADWCPHCQAIQSYLRSALARHPDVRHIKVADGKGKPLGRSFRVKLWPNLVFLRDGRVVQQSVRPEPTEVEAGLAAITDPALE